MQQLVLTHYHHKNEKPFKTLSALGEQEAIAIMSRLGSQSGEVYRRFKNPEKYLRLRKATETWLRQEFILKGGQPLRLHPNYFVVGRSSWIEEGYNGQSNAVQVPLSDFDFIQVSFTYPDSMVSYWLKTQTDKAFYHADYHGQVFTFDEISRVIEAFGMPGEAWRTEKSREHDIFIEAQFWGEL